MNFAPPPLLPPAAELGGPATGLGPEQKVAGMAPDNPFSDKSTARTCSKEAIQAGIEPEIPLWRRSQPDPKSAQPDLK